MLLLPGGGSVLFSLVAEKLRGGTYAISNQVELHTAALIRSANKWGRRSRVVLSWRGWNY